MSLFSLTVIDTSEPRDCCINNNNIRTLNGNHHSQPNNCVPNSALPNTVSLHRGKSQPQSNSVTMPAPEDGNVLKKVISFTLDQINNAEKTARPSFVPEKLHFSAYEQFKGKLSSFVCACSHPNHYSRSITSCTVAFCIQVLSSFGCGFQL